MKRLLEMRLFLVVVKFGLFWGQVVFRWIRLFSHLNTILGVIGLLILAIVPKLLIVEQWLKNLNINIVDWFIVWGWIMCIIIAFVWLFLWSPFKVWEQTDDDRERLQSRIDSNQSNVEFTDFNHKLQYKRMKDSRGDVIVFRLAGRLRNNSLQNSGCLDFFRVEVDTPYGSFIAKSSNPPLGHKFEPNSIYPNNLYTFDGELLSPHIGSWEPHIKGAEGRINLVVQGQTIRTYPIKIADEEGFYEL